MNKKKNLALAIIIASISLCGCGGGGGDNGNSTNTSINLNIDSGNLYEGTSYEITTSNVESLSAKYGSVTKRAQTQSDTDSIIYVWDYTLSDDQIRNITKFPYNEEFYFTSTTGTTGSKIITISPTNLDPLLVQQWHLSNNGYNYFDTTLSPVKGLDLNITNAWKQKDNQGRHITGKEINVIVFDSSVDFNHEDLPEPYTPIETYQLDMNETLSLEDLSEDNGASHGTKVSGIIGARANNGLGGRGIAYDSNLSSLSILYIENDYQSLNSFKLISDARNVDVVNASFSIIGSFDIDFITLYLQEGYENNIPFVQAIGNYFSSKINDTMIYSKDCINLKRTSVPVDCTFVQTSSLERSPYNILVGAINSQGKKSSYSSTGSNLWISALGGEFGYNANFQETSAAIVTTLSSYNLNQELPEADFDKNSPWRNSQNVNYTAMMNGTSSATPEITGIVALVKQARPTVTVPQVRYILAKTARNNNAISNMNYEPIYDDNDLMVEQGWITNDAGWKFSKYYGFGLADAGKAVELALNCDEDPLCKQKDELPVEYVSSNSNPCKALNDKYGNTVTECNFTDFKGIDSNSVSLPNNAQIDNVSVYFDCLPIKEATSASEANPYIQFELISNNGTKSIIKNMYSNWDYFHKKKESNSYTNYGSSAFYHESISANDSFIFRAYSKYPIDVSTINSNCDMKLHIWAYKGL